MRRILVVSIAAALVACGGSTGTTDLPTFTLPDLTEDPGGFNGEQVKILGGYYGAFEVSVLTSGITEDSPPEPVGPLVWVGVSPSGDCVQSVGEGRVSWAESVEATGVFRYDPDGGFGHLGAYEIALENATVTCA